MPKVKPLLTAETMIPTYPTDSWFSKDGFAKEASMHKHAHHYAKWNEPVAEGHMIYCMVVLTWDFRDDQTNSNSLEWWSRGAGWEELRNLFKECEVPVIQD